MVTIAGCKGNYERVVISRTTFLHSSGFQHFHRWCVRVYYPYADGAPIGLLQGRLGVRGLPLSAVVSGLHVSGTCARLRQTVTVPELLDTLASQALNSWYQIFAFLLSGCIQLTWIGSMNLAFHMRRRVGKKSRTKIDSRAINKSDRNCGSWTSDRPSPPSSFLPPPPSLTAQNTVCLYWLHWAFAVPLLVCLFVCLFFVICDLVSVDRKSCDNQTLPSLPQGSACWECCERELRWRAWGVNWS